MNRVLVAMSGGVDSSVAAWILKQQGYDCVGVTMRLHSESAGSAGSTCCTSDDIEDARRVCEALGIPHHVVDFSADFDEKVILPFIRCYETGKTPNPCINCNRRLKFERLYEQGGEMGCDLIATGHYVRLTRSPSGIYEMRKALDASKEQSYVLYSLSQDQLAHTLFPLGGMTKAEVRAIAEARGFINADKPESQDICFIPDGDYASFIRRYTGKEYPEGPVLDLQGNHLGTHRGIIHYTIGQRKGLGLALGEPMYVARTDAETNTVYLGHKDEVYANTVYAKGCSWTTGTAPENGTAVTARVRYHQTEQPASLYLEEGGLVKAVFSRPQRAVTPGQAIVFYIGDLVLGGAEIVRSENCRAE